MITLLLALFIILFAISSINGKKFIEFETGLTQSFTNQSEHPKSSTSLLPDESGLESHPNLSTTPTSNLSEIYQKITQDLKAAGLSQDTSVTVQKQGVVVQMFTSLAYFANDRATLEPLGDEVIDTIGSVLATVSNHVEVQGYTDNVPITGGPYVSNWELSGARASAAVVRLISHDGITPARLSAMGFGTTHPIASNATTAGRAENRRIDIVILTPKVTAPGVTTTLKEAGT